LSILNEEKVSQSAAGTSVADGPTGRRHRVDDDAVADSHTIDFGTDVDHLAGGFVSEGVRPCRGGTPPSAMYIASDPQMPQARIRTRTSRGPTVGSGVLTTAV